MVKRKTLKADVREELDKTKGKIMSLPRFIKRVERKRRTKFGKNQIAGIRKTVREYEDETGKQWLPIRSEEGKEKDTLDQILESVHDLQGRFRGMLLQQVLPPISEGVDELQRMLREKIETEKEEFAKINKRLDEIELRGIFSGDLSPKDIERLSPKLKDSDINAVPGKPGAKCREKLYVYPELPPYDYMLGDYNKDKRSKEWNKDDGFTDFVCENLREACDHAKRCGQVGKNREVVVFISPENAQGQCWEEFLDCMEKCKQMYGTKLTVIYRNK